QVVAQVQPPGGPVAGEHPVGAGVAGQVGLDVGAAGHGPVQAAVGGRLGAQLVLVGLGQDVGSGGIRTHAHTVSAPARPLARRSRAPDAQIEVPTTRPLNRHPARNVPSRARRPCTPPPPNPAASPAAYSPSITLPSGPSTRPERSVCTPPSVLRVSSCSRTASSRPSFGVVSGRGGATRIRLSTTYPRA